MLDLAPRPAENITRSDTVHVVCWCVLLDPLIADVALCGADVTDDPITEADDDATCVVCADLEFQPCPNCGD